MSMDRFEQLTEQPIKKLLYTFSVPAIVGMVVNAIYNIISSIFVGLFINEEALAAVTFAFPIMLVLFALSVLIGIGGSSLLSLKLGANRKREANLILGNIFTLSVIFYIISTAIMVFFLTEILTFLGASNQVLVYAEIYTLAIVWGSIAMYLSFTLNTAIRAEGNPKVAMITLLIAAVICVILNPIFIITLDMGVLGSALAVVIAQGVSAVWVIAYFFTKTSVLKLQFLNLFLRKKIVKEIFTIGLAPFAMQLAASLVFVISNFQLLAYGGDLAVAAGGVINRVFMLILMPIIGVSQGAQPILGYNYGAGNFKRVLQTLKLASWTATACALIGCVFCQVFAEFIIRSFNNNPELIAIGSLGIRIFTIALPIIGFQIIAVSYFQSIGKPIQSGFLSISRQVLFFIPLLLVLPNYFELNGIWLATPVSDVLGAICCVGFLYFEAKRIDKLTKEKSY
ncbi:MATE family efflux transporter [Selenomonadales bacterium OttesenSCG-928-I06]|nr:MATE family efflux transporter [Selenomonadales bacterium OttesenSCG-928-I06]